MMSPLSPIHRIFGAPIAAVRSLGSTIMDFQHAAARQRAMLVGLPSFLLFVGGITVMVIAATGQEGRLIDRYAELARKTNESFQAKYNEFFRELNQSPTAPNAIDQEDEGTSSPSENGLDSGTAAEAIATTGDGSTNEEEAMDSLSELRQELRALRREEQIYWRKLISLQPQNDEYRFNYALAFKFDNNDEMTRLISGLAPENRPGYPKAQLEMARNYFNYAVQNPQFKAQALNKALTHAENCLKVQTDDTVATVIKARALNDLGRSLEAYVVFEELFKKNPSFYGSLYEINKSLGRENRNNSILESAQTRLRDVIREQRGNLTAWAQSWSAYVDCLMKQNRIDIIRRDIQNEMTAIKDLEDFEVRRRELNRLLATTLNIAAQNAIPDRFNVPEGFDFSEILSLISEAHELDPKSVITVQLITNLLLFYPVEKAPLLEMYNPYEDPDPPGFVLELLGSHALGQNNFSEAVSYLERARALTPENPTVLNNLAYSYLAGPKIDPDRALFLANQALNAMQRSKLKQDKSVISRLMHTRGSAYLALERYVEAQADFAIALDGRPDNTDILDALIKCCQATGDTAQQEIYQARLDELKSGSGQ